MAFRLKNLVFPAQNYEAYAGCRILMIIVHIT